MKQEPSTPSPNLKSMDLQRKWMDEIHAARKRDKDFLKDGAEVIKLYESCSPEQNQFNIVYSNTETLGPAVYNNTPRPVVQRRFRDKDKLGGMAAQTTTRMLAYLQDTGDEDYPDFDDLMKPAILGALLPGRGVTRFKYEAKIEQGEAPADGGEAPAKVTYEIVCGEDVPWDRFLCGYAKTWKKLGWIGFVHDMTFEELEQNFGADIARNVPMGEGAEDEVEDGTGQRGLFGGKPEDTGRLRLSRVYEIWDKVHRKVLFLCEGYKLGPLKEVDDPLQLQGFFPCPQPLQFYAKLSSLTPTNLWMAYKEQAKELNAITIRIRKIVNALKVRGFYDATVAGIEQVLQADDNVLIPLENAATITSQKQKIADALHLLPIEQLVTVVQQLYLAREQCKQVIYEITGISDILRGASVASETATAQNIKNQWGTLRLKRMQREVMRYTRDCLRIMAEIGVTKFSVETMQKITGLGYVTEEVKQQAAAAIQQAQHQAGINPQAGGQGQPQLPPELQEAATSTSWEEVMALLKDDQLRNFRVDIETNSTVDVEATEDKEAIGELLNAIAQFLSGAGPLVEQGILPFEAAKTILLSVVRRFRFGTEVEDQIAQMAPPQPKADPAVEKAKLEQQKMQQQMEVDQQKAQIELQKMQAEVEMEKQRMELEKQKMQMELQKMQMEMEYARFEHGMKMQAQQAATQAKVTTAQIGVQSAQQQAEIAAQSGQQQLDLKQQQGEQAIAQGEAMGKQKLAQGEAAAKAKAKQQQVQPKAPAK